MTASTSNQFAQLELDVSQNVKQFPNLDHFDEIWKEMAAFKTNDGANFQQDLVQLNKDLHSQGVLPGLEIVDGVPKTNQTPEGFGVVDTNKLASDIKDAAKNPNANMDGIWQMLAAVEKSQSPDEFKQFLQQLNSQFTPDRQIVETSPFKFDWQPKPPDTPSGGSSDSSGGGSSSPSETPWINPNGASDNGGGGGGGGGSSAGGGGGGRGGGDSGGGGASDSSGGSDSSTTDSGPYTGPLGNSAGDATTAEVVKDAEGQIGVPYRFDWEKPKGGSTSEQEAGFDCSGLTKWAWAQAGVDLPHNADAQYHDTAHVTHVPLSQLQPGDLLFYNDGGSIHHVTMYVGNGKMVEAPHTGATVREVPVRTQGLMPEAGRPHK